MTELLKAIVFMLEGISGVQLCTAQKMKSSIKDFFSKYDQIRRKLRIWSHLLKKSIMENFICVVIAATRLMYYVYVMQFSSVKFTRNINHRYFHFLFEIASLKMSLIFSDLQYLLPSFSLVTLEKMFLLKCIP